MEFIKVEYNQNLERLEKLLADVRRPGDFYVHGSMETPMPKVDVRGVGTLSFPVSQEQIGAIVGQAERAPYGRGRETLVDTSVRKVWQIAPGRVKVGGGSWQETFGNILSSVTRGLGCEGASVSAELYKLLVYDRGGFFLPHRDAEKTAGMFGTLVVTLPSAHQGGALAVRHAGTEAVIDTGGAEFSEISWVAFYADCEHEARPVRKGNRVCLVYNLVQKRGRGRKRLIAPEYEPQIAAAAEMLGRALKATAVPGKIAWLLEYQYSPAGLAFAALKGADAARAGVLVQAAERADCVAHLGIVHIGDSGGAEPDYDGEYFGWGWDRDETWDDDGDEDDDERDEDMRDDDDGESFTVVTVDDSWQYVDEWRDTGDRPVEFGPIPLGDGELLPAGALDGEKPDRQRLTEASGNEGATYERSYHRAALVLWHRKRYAEVLLEAGVVAALPYFRQLVEKGAATRKEAAALARRMIGDWSDDSERWGSYPARAPESGHRTEMIALLRQLGDAGLLERFITKAVTPGYDGSENAELVAAAGTLGVVKAPGVLSALVASRTADRPSECAELLLALSEKPSKSLLKVARALVSGIDRTGVTPPRAEDFGWEPEERRRPPDARFIVNLLAALARLEAGTLRATAAGKLAARPEVFDPVSVVVPALEQIGGARSRTDAAFRHLWTPMAEFLLERSARPPEPPSDWRQKAALSCKCSDCRELQAFARDPGERVHRFRVRKDRRRHLHNAIKEHGLDMTHVTERRGSPQTLVCTKDRRGFDRRIKEYKREIAAMRTLVDLAPATAGARTLAERMTDAVAGAPK